jgi:hypothetical protein
VGPPPAVVPQRNTLVGITILCVVATLLFVASLFFYITILLAPLGLTRSIHMHIYIYIYIYMHARMCRVLT